MGRVRFECGRLIPRDARPPPYPCHEAGRGRGSAEGGERHSRSPRPPFPFGLCTRRHRAPPGRLPPTAMTKPVSFVSPWAPDLRAFLASKRAVGRIYDRAEFRVRSLDRFAAEYVQQHGVVELGRLIPLWLSRRGGNCKPTTVRAEHSVARQFCLYLRRRDPRCFVPGPELSPAGGTRFLPYIFSMGDMRRLLRGTDSLQRCRSSSYPSFRAMTFRTLILVLYCTGLRLGEAI